MFGGANLIGERLDPRPAGDDFVCNLIDHFVDRECGAAQARLLGMNASEIEKAARPNAPGEQRHVVLGFAEMSGLAVHSAAEPAEKRLAADTWNQRTINRTVLRMLSGAEKRRALLRFGPCCQSL